MANNSDTNARSPFDPPTLPPFRLGDALAESGLAEIASLSASASAAGPQSPDDESDSDTASEPAAAVESPQLIAQRLAQDALARMGERLTHSEPEAPPKKKSLAERAARPPKSAAEVVQATPTAPQASVLPPAPPRKRKKGPPPPVVTALPPKPSDVDTVITAPAPEAAVPTPLAAVPTPLAAVPTPLAAVPTPLAAVPTPLAAVPTPPDPIAPAPSQGAPANNVIVVPTAPVTAPAPLVPPAPLAGSGTPPRPPQALLRAVLADAELLSVRQLRRPDVVGALQVANRTRAQRDGDWRAAQLAETVRRAAASGEPLYVGRCRWRDTELVVFFTDEAAIGMHDDVELWMAGL